MKITPIAYPINFGCRSLEPQIRYVSPEIKRTIKTYRLSCGKKLTVTDEYTRDKLTSRLYYLKDKAGKWLKSRLEYFQDGKRTKVLKSKKE